MAAALLATALAACGGGGDDDPCAIDPHAEVVIGCPACANYDGSPCPPLMPPTPCPAPGCPT